MDHRKTAAGRRQSWYGLKRYVKTFLSLSIPHAVLRRAVALAPQLARDGRLPAPRHLTEVRGSVGDRAFVMRRPDRCVVAKELYWGGGQRPRREDQFALEVVASLARDADVFIDIGAYTGIFTLAAARANPGLHAHAFEIVPDVYHLLFDNCVRNDILDRVTLHHEGIGPDGTTMRVPVGARGSALPDFYSRRLHFDDGASVRFVSLDRVTESLTPESRMVVKIDVEGTEDEVLSGGSRFLSAHRPDILCEVLAGVARPAEISSALAPNGYRCYLVGRGELLPRDRLEPSAAFRDWLFTTRDADVLAAAGIRVSRSLEPAR